MIVNGKSFKDRVLVVDRLAKLFDRYAMLQKYYVDDFAH